MLLIVCISCERSFSLRFVVLICRSEDQSCYESAMCLLKAFDSGFIKKICEIFTRSSKDALIITFSTKRSHDQGQKSTLCKLLDGFHCSLLLQVAPFSFHACKLKWHRIEKQLVSVYSFVGLLESTCLSRTYGECLYVCIHLS